MTVAGKSLQLLIVLVTFAVYSGVLNAAFTVWDD